MCVCVFFVLFLFLFKMKSMGTRNTPTFILIGSKSVFFGGHGPTYKPEGIKKHGGCRPTNLTIHGIKEGARRH